VVEGVLDALDHTAARSRRSCSSEPIRPSAAAGYESRSEDPARFLARGSRTIRASDE
jgi:hypothetical protein